jgi:hypothetical protein
MVPGFARRRDIERRVDANRAAGLQESHERKQVFGMHGLELTHDVV